MNFVVGTGRCGMKTLSRTLKECGLEVTFNMGDPEEWTRMRRSCLLYRCHPKSAIRDLTYMLERLKGDVQVNRDFSLIVPVIRQVHENAKFVWIKRDRRSVVDSMANHPDWYNPKSPWCDWELRGNLFDKGISREGWKLLTKVGKCAWQVRYVEDLLNDTLPGTPTLMIGMGNKMELDTLRAGCAHLGASIQPIEVHHEDRRKDEYPDWTEEGMKEFNRFINATDDTRTDS